ncbi:MAG: hypothetical protein ACFFDQ_14050, partial [Candidatus Thorarchaeota archaeon]
MELAPGIFKSSYRVVFNVMLLLQKPWKSATIVIPVVSEIMTLASAGVPGSVSSKWTHGIGVEV